MTDTVLGAAPVRPAPFAPYHKWDRNFFLALVAGVWAGILMGFGGDIRHHIQSNEAAYPWIVHVHAAAFVGWLVLFTTQVLLIRAKRPQLHYRLGASMMWLALFMVIIGPATAIYMQRQQFGTPDSDPAFVAIQFTDIIAFAGLVVAGYRARGRSSAHKRLMLLSTIYISDAGFARWLGSDIGGALGHGFWAFLLSAYLMPQLLMLSLGVYDLVTRKRLYPAYVWGVAWALGLQLTAAYLYIEAPFWKGVATHLIGH
ncbi:MAG TPA: hypothetical protein VG387_11800 [Rhizomicrobium sp.]|jgi:hypothetical protein|nr:hypothetical protein [Rhizomicrobium sp.]